MSIDVKRYIQNCLKCTCHDSAQKSQLLHFVRVEYSFQLLRFDFIDSLSISVETEDFYIFHVIDYFSRFFITFSFKIANVSNVLSALQRIFTLYATFKVIYCDKEHYFINQMIIRFLKRHEIFYFFSSSDSSQSINMMKIENRLLKNILRKFEFQNWQNVLDQVIKNLNNRMIRHLKASFSAIFMKISSNNVIIDFAFQVFTNTVATWIDQLMNVYLHQILINNFMKTRRRLQILIFEQSQYKKNVEIFKYNKNIREHNFKSDDLIMIF
jgi:hypothetical protein